jgi:hypothetical protein
MHSKAVVTKPQNVFVMRDVMLNGYIGGGGVQWFPNKPAEFKDKLNRRLSLDEELMAGEVPAIFPIPVAFNSTIGDVVSVSDRMLPWMTARDANYQFNSFPGGTLSYIAMQNLGMDLGSIHYGEDKRTIAAQEFISNGTINNSMCFLGPHRRQSDFMGGRYVLVPGARPLIFTYDARIFTRLLQRVQDKATLGRTRFLVSLTSTGWSATTHTCTCTHMPDHLACCFAKVTLAGVAEKRPCAEEILTTTCAQAGAQAVLTRALRAQTMEACRSELQKGNDYTIQNGLFQFNGMAV